MVTLSDLDLPETPRLARNITHFARALRRAGLPIGPGRVVEAIRAVAAAGFTERQDFYWTLHSCLVSRREHSTVFAQVFRLYWRDPRYLEHMMAMLTPTVRGVQDERRARPAETRAAEALLAEVERPAPARPEAPAEDTPIDIDASRTSSGEERLRSLDFEQMSLAEMAAAKRLLATMRLDVPPVLTRRTRADPHGPRPDWRRTAQLALRRGGEIRDLARRSRRTRPPALVVLCDISGSMAQYSRAVLQFVHAVANARGQGWAEVHAFTFGTRLTNITRHLRTRDVDAALAAAGAEAQDWEGGTRIGECLAAFNRDWSRRVLSGGAVVLLITDGLDRSGEAGVLEKAVERLSLSCRQLIWLNPLLRFDAFAPKAAGIRAILPHVTALRAGHNIAALEGLSEALSRPLDPGEKRRLLAQM